jgi:hypothetical protein
MSRAGQPREPVVYYKSVVRTRGFDFDRDGVGRRWVNFGSGEVRRVDLVLSNGSARTADCFSDRAEPFYSCFGVPRDDDRRYSFRARLR